MSSYRHIVPNIYAEMSVHGEPKGLPTGVSFRTGAPIAVAIESPLVYEAPYTSPGQLQHFESELVPLMSERLVDALLTSGVSNLQLFPAQVFNPGSGARWTGFHAVNVVGLIACSSPLSDGRVVAVRPDGLPLMVFNRLTIDTAKTGGAGLFRLAESPGSILIAERVLDQVRAKAPPGGWNITAYPVADA